MRPFHRTSDTPTADGDPVPADDRAWMTPGCSAAGVRGQGKDRTRFAMPGLRVSTATAAVAYPFLAQAPLTHKGTFLGTNLGTGAPFCFSPFEAYRDGLITNPNILVAGEIGSGKTNTTCALTLRSIPLGFRVAAVDAKADWARFARTYGGSAISIGPGRGNRLNPLDVSDALLAARVDAEGNPIDPTVLAKAGQLRLLEGLIEIRLNRSLAVDEKTAIALALEQALHASGGSPILSDIAAALRSPDPVLASGISRTVPEMLDAGNAARWAFDGLLSTVAKDLFDGPSTTRFDSTAPIVAIDLSDLYNDNANLSIAFTCASAWMEAALATPGNGQRFAVYDEAWRVLAHAHGAIDRLQQQFRLARSWGLSNVLVLHNLRDTLNIGAAGSAERNKAESLLALAGTKVIGYQPAKELPATTVALDLTHAEADVIANASRGEFLVKLQTTAGTRSYRIHVDLHPRELSWWDTTAGMHANPLRFPEIPTVSTGT
jgi:type IV secretory pathway VirB4 component